MSKFQTVRRKTGEVAGKTADVVYKTCKGLGLLALVGSLGVGGVLIAKGEREHNAEKAAAAAAAAGKTVCGGVFTAADFSREVMPVPADNSNWREDNTSSTACEYDLTLGPDAETRLQLTLNCHATPAQWSNFRRTFAPHRFSGVHNGLIDSVRTPDASTAAVHTPGGLLLTASLLTTSGVEVNPVAGHRPAVLSAVLNEAMSNIAANHIC